MGDVLGAACMLVIGVFVFAAIGHGLWLLGASILRIITAGEPGQTPRRRCPECGGELLLMDRLCPSCGVVVERDAAMAPVTTPVTELERLERKLHSLADRGVIDYDTRDQLVAVVHAEAARHRHEAVTREQIAAPESGRATVQALEGGSVEVPKRRERRPAPSEPGEVPLEIVEFAAEEPPTKLRPLASESSQPGARPPVRPLGSLLQSFMEERNIRWGELVSGVLIVGSAIGLVISLWASLREAIPYFPALLFMLVTAAIHGAGLYTLRRWKLKSTSRGLLTIATLLVPLNFLAAIALSEPDRRPATDPYYIAAIVVGLAVFGGLTWSAGRRLLFYGPWLMFAAVMGPSVGQLFISRLATRGTNTTGILLLALLPAAGYVAATMGQIRMASRWRRVTERRIGQMFLLLGISTLSLVVSWSLLVWKAGDPWETLGRLSPLISLAAASVLSLGLLVHARATGPELASLRTAGTAVALVGASLMLAAIVLAWPQQGLLIAVALVNFAVLTALGCTSDVAALHGAAVVSLAWGGLIGFHFWQGTAPADGAAPGRELLAALLMGRSAVVLTVLAAFTAAAALGFRRQARPTEATGYLLGTAAIAGFGLAAALYAGFWSQADGSWTTLVLATDSVAALIACRKLRQRIPSGIASGLTFVGLLHAFLWNDWIIGNLTASRWQPEHPLLLVLLLHASISAGTALWAERQQAPSSTANHRSLRRGFIGPLSATAWASSIFGAFLVLLTEHAWPGGSAVYALWIALIWFVQAIIHQSKGAFTAGQVAATAAVAFGVTAVCRTRPWWNESYLDPWHVQAQISVLAAWAVLWIPVRTILATFSSTRAFSSEDFLNLERPLVIVLSAAAVLLALLGATPPISAEFEAWSGPATLSEVRRLIVLAPILVAAAAIAAGVKTVVRGRSREAFFLAAGITAFLVLPVWDRSVEAYWSAVGAFPSHATGLGGWIAVGMCTLALVLQLCRQFAVAEVLTLTCLWPAVPLLLAARMGAAQGSASSLRWILTILAVLLSLIVSQRRRFLAPLQRSGWHVPEQRPEWLPRSMRTLTVAVTVLPVLALTLRFALVAGLHIRVEVPPTLTIFAQMGAATSYAAPLGIFAALFLWHAVRNNAGFAALAGSLLCSLAATMAWAVRLWTSGGPLGGAALVELLQWNALTFGGYSLLWIALTRLKGSPLSMDRDKAADATLGHLAVWSPLWMQMALMQLTVGALGMWAFAATFLWPGDLSAAMKSLGGIESYLAVALAVTASLTAVPEDWKTTAAGRAVFLGATIVGLAAASASAVNNAENWLAFHTLLGGTALLAVLATVADWMVPWDDAPASNDEVAESGRGLAVGWRGVLVGMEQSIAQGAALVGCLTALVAVRGVVQDPSGPWWSTGGAAVSGLCAAGLALRHRSQAYAYASAVLAALATTFVWTTPWFLPGREPSPQDTVHLVEAVVVAFALAGLVWQLVELWWQRREGSPWDPLSQFPVYQAAAVVGLVMSGGLALGGLVMQTMTERPADVTLPDVSNRGGWLMIASLAALLIAALWDRFRRHAVWGLYALGLITLTMLLDELRLSPRFVWFGAAALASAYVLLTGLVWYATRTWNQWRSVLGFPEPLKSHPTPHRWLPTCNMLLGALAVAVGFYIVLQYPERPLRLYGSLAVAGLAPGWAMLAASRALRIRAALRLASLLVLAVAGIDVGWALMDVDLGRYESLYRAIRLMVSLAAATFVYGFLVVRLVSPTDGWFAEVRRAATITGAAALAMLLVVLGLEMLAFTPGGGVPMTGLQIAVVAGVLVALAAALISLAVLPGRDPLNLSERGRMFYVYVAEGVLALLFLHIYLTMPQLFQGYLRPYWPLIVIAISFAGAGAGEWFRRAGLWVLAEPLQRTGAFLPLLPALGFWVFALRREVATDYSTVLFFAGIVYIFLSVWRKSLVFAVVAGLVGNAGLWALWYEHGHTILAHPQLWLIPPALSVLVAAQLNRRQLSEAQLTAIRYFCVTVIYVSSTGEMFITGVAESLWMPIILATLSVVGVFVGILLHVRAFLYLGTSFLMLSVVSMVWHAAQNIGHVWPWWAFGIVLGLLILTVFGLFEKKRNEMLKLIQELREWEH